MVEEGTVDHIYWYLSEVQSRIVAKSGIPTDRYHIGKIALQSFNDDPNFIAQIDGGTDEFEDNRSLLKRSIQCALSFKALGLKKGDVMVLAGPNHLDLSVPFYAAMYLGVIIAPVDRFLKVGEFENAFSFYKPSIVICQSEKYGEMQAALETTSSRAKVVTFDKQADGTTCLADLLTADDEDVNKFEAEDFNAEESVAMILPTSGSTGLPKGAAITYRTLMITGPHIWARFTKFPSPICSWLILSPMQWLTAMLNFIVSPFIKYTRIQTSKPVTIEHTKYLINTYKPTSSVIGPTTLVQLLKSGSEQCDMTCFEVLLVAGSAVDKEIIELLQVHAPNTITINAFGMTETTTIVFQGDCPPGACGKPGGIFQYRLVNLESQNEVKKPYEYGELWLKGPMFKEYYNNPEATRAAITEDGWFKTGDMFYRDEHLNYFFVERIKLLMKYKHYQVSPAEIERAIRTHPDVLDVAVIGVPDPLCGDLPAACVIPKSGCTPSAQDIKDLVKEKLSDAKQLRGGVLFVTSFPLTSTSKINRMKLSEMVREMKFD